MKKKFLISGAAVFLAVCLLTSALFAFADLPSVVFFEKDSDNNLTVISDIPSPTYDQSTSDGGNLKFYYAYDGIGVFVFPNYYNYFYYNNPSIVVYCCESFPSAGDNLSDFSTMTIEGVNMNDSFMGTDIYRFDLPSDYPYYLRAGFCIYTPPLFMKVNSFISGFFSAAGDFFDGVMSVPILAILVLGVPVTGLITAITLSLTVGRKKYKTYKKSRRRR